MALTKTFLELSPEFGGTKFGPFDGPEVRLGCDPDRNEITLPENLGVAPEHLKVLIQGDGSYILAPVVRTAAVYLWRQGASRGKQLNSPMAVNPGDGFSLVTAEGPRFYISAEKPREINLDDVEGQHQKKSMGPLGNRIIKEIRRRGVARFFTTGIGRQANKAWMFLRQGQFMSPYYLIGGMTAMSGFIFAGGTSCAALGYANQQGPMKADLRTCEDQLESAKNMQSSDGESIPGLTAQILDDPSWDGTLLDDPTFRRAYLTEMKAVFGAHDRYKWVYETDPPDNPYEAFNTALTDQGLDTRLVRVLSYAAATPTFGRTDIDFRVLEPDALGRAACGRGPVALTYRQAVNMGMENVQVDAVVERSVVTSSDVDQKIRMLKATGRSAGATLELGRDKVDLIGNAGLQGEKDCIFIKGEDDRTDPERVAEALTTVMNGEGVPNVGAAFWVEARLFRFYGADLGKSWKNFTFGDARAPTFAAEQMAFVPKEGREQILTQSASVLARAIAIPCLKLTDKDWRERPREFLGAPPREHNCAVLEWFRKYEQQ